MQRVLCVQCPSLTSSEAVGLGLERGSPSQDGFVYTEKSEPREGAALKSVDLPANDWRDCSGNQVRGWLGSHRGRHCHVLKEKERDFRSILKDGRESQKRDKGQREQKS